MAATNVVVSNSYVSSNPDFPVRSDLNAANERIQVVRIDTGSGTSEVPLTQPFQVKGPVPEGGAVSNPVQCGYKEAFFNTAVVPHCITVAGISYQLMLAPDASLNFISYTTAGETYALSHSTDGAKTGATYARLGVNKEVRVAAQPTATPTNTNVSGSTSSVTLSASDTTRYFCSVFNDSSSELYLKLGSTASSTSFTAKLQKNDYYEVPAGYTGIVTGAWVTATGAARVTELRV